MDKHGVGYFRPINPKGIKLKRVLGYLIGLSLRVDMLAAHRKFPARNDDHRHPIFF
jgi:hypothetical protein